MPGFESAINSQIRQPRVDLPFCIKEIVNVDAVNLTYVHPDHWDEFADVLIKFIGTIFKTINIDI